MYLKNDEIQLHDDTRTEEHGPNIWNLVFNVHSFLKHLQKAQFFDRQ